MSETKAPAPAPEETKELVRLGEAMERIQIDEETGLPIPKSMQDQVAIAAWSVKSGLLPDSIRTTAQAWMVMQRGSELGFPGLTAFEYLYPVKGRVRLTPDGAKAKALASGLLEDFKEETFGEGAGLTARVTIKRRGIPTPIIYEFSVQDAIIAGLAGGDNWKRHPKRMTLARARGFAFGDAFRDVIGGLQVREMFDLDPGEKIEAPIQGRTAAAPPPPPGPDPLVAELAGTPAPAIEAGPVEMASHSEKEIPAEPEPRAAPAVHCKHEKAGEWLNRKGNAKRVYACSECTLNVRLDALGNVALAGEQ